MLTIYQSQQILMYPDLRVYNLGKYLENLCAFVYRMPALNQTQRREARRQAESQLLRLSLRLGRDRDLLVWKSRQAEDVTPGRRLR